jgi:hypothetical protein
LVVHDHIDFLKVLDQRIRTILVLPNPMRLPRLRSLSRLSGWPLLYAFIKFAKIYPSERRRLRNTLRRASCSWSTLKLSACERPIPIFALGCEARTDEQRANTVDLISRTEKEVTSRLLSHVTVSSCGILRGLSSKGRHC